MDHNTRKAVMNPARLGSFVSTSRILNNIHINVNHNIADLWLLRTSEARHQLRHIADHYLNNLLERCSPEVWVRGPPQGLQVATGLVRTMRNWLVSLFERFNHQAISDFIQALLSFQNVYRVDRDTLPTYEEVAAVFEYMNTQINNVYLQPILNTINYIVEHLNMICQPVVNPLPREFLDAFGQCVDLLLHMEGAPIIGEWDITCGVCFERYSEEIRPVELICGHVFCNLCLERIAHRNARGPYCRTPYQLDGLRESAPILRRAIAYREPEAEGVPVAEPINWHATIWQTVVAELQSRNENTDL